MSANSLHNGSRDIACLPHVRNYAQYSSPFVARARLCSLPFARVEGQPRVESHQALLDLYRSLILAPA
jgi:hypothetical protein